MRIGVPREVHPGEVRVAATPETAKRLQKLGFSVLVEAGAGHHAQFRDEDYRDAGCEVTEDVRDIWQCDVVIKVRAPMDHPKAGLHEAELLREGGHLISYLWPGQNEALVERLAARKATVLAMDCIPRITRAQKCDALSSMANIAGYRAVVEAAQHFGRFFTGQITAAGKVPPAKILVIGAGVAGLAAIGAARGMGAQVLAFDTRPVVAEQVQSMGAQFLTVEIEEDGTGTGGYSKTMSEAFIEAEHRLFEEQAKDVDVIITTALIPNRPAPLLVTEQAVTNMKAGSVVVDLAAERGGNVAGTVKDEIVVKDGVTLIGLTNLACRMPTVASTLYGNNVAHLLDDMGGGEDYNVDEADAVVRGALVLHQGEMRWPAPKAEPTPQVAKPKAPKAAPAKPAPKSSPKSGDAHGHAAPPPPATTTWVVLALVGAALVGIGWSGSDDFLSHFTVFVLACFVGWQLIWNVSAALHTPLMAVTNAISGIIIVGGMLQIGGAASEPATLLGAAAILLAMINVAGGFLVTQRMLRMFHR